MRIRVIYLGGSRLQAHCKQEELVLPANACVADAVQAIATAHPELVPFLDSVRWACNYEFAAPERLLDEGDELALVPPVTGGAPQAWVTPSSLSVDLLLTHLQLPGVGAVVLFVGTVRNHNQGHSVEALTYEAYGPMAQRQLERIALDLTDSAADCNTYIQHRVGHLQIGDIAVLVGSAAPHRAGAFAACQTAIERIKVEVPIYKCERSCDGETWLGWGGG